MSNQSEFDWPKFLVWCFVLVFCIAFWAGVALLVDWMI